MMYVSEVESTLRQVDIESNDIVKVVQGRDNDVSVIMCVEW